MKTMLTLFLAIFFISAGVASYGQNEIKTLFGGNALCASGGYGALTNKFTKIGGQYTSMSGVYGGWYINHKFTLGVSAAAVTNNLLVPDQYSALPGKKMNYEYGQVGLLTEYVIGSNRTVHVAVQLFSGAGFTTQYQRDLKDNHDLDSDKDKAHDTNWFIVTEPGVNIEVNIFRWMRFCPGVSYRAAFGSDGQGLRDKDINGASLNLGLKLGRF